MITAGAEKLAMLWIAVGKARGVVNIKAARAKLDGACEMVSALGLAPSETTVWTAVRDAYNATLELLGPRPDSLAAWGLKEWDDRFAIEIQERIG